MTVIVPADAYETAKAVRAVAAFHGPAYVRLGRSSMPVVCDFEGYNFLVGKSVLMKDGADVSIIACGIMVAVALEAAETLKNEGIGARVINMHTIKPLDKDAISKAAGETGAIVTAEEHSIIGGLGAAVCEFISGENPVPVVRVGVKDTFAESGKPADLLEKYCLTPGDIVKAARSALSLKGKK